MLPSLVPPYEHDLGTTWISSTHFSEIILSDLETLDLLGLLVPEAVLRSVISLPKEARSVQREIRKSFGGVADEHLSTKNEINSVRKLVPVEYPTICLSRQRHSIVFMHLILRLKMLESVIRQLLGDLSSEVETSAFKEVLELFIDPGKQSITEMILNRRLERFEEIVLLHILEVQIPIIVIKTGDVHSEVSFHSFLNIRLLNSSNEELDLLIFEIFEFRDGVDLVDDKSHLRQHPGEEAHPNRDQTALEDILYGMMPRYITIPNCREGLNDPVEGGKIDVKDVRNSQHFLLIRNPTFIP